MVRAQGGTETAVRLGLFSEDFYRSQPDRGRARLRLRRAGLLHALLLRARGRAGRGPDRDAAAPGGRGPLGGARRVRRHEPVGAPRPDARCVVRARRRLSRPAAQRARLHRGGPGCRRPGLRAAPRSPGSVGPATTSWAWRPRPAPSTTERVVLTGGPTLAAVGRAAGGRIPAGGARHQVVVTGPHPDFAPDRLPMVFDVASGIYWRPCEGGVLWGMSNPDEAPGEALEFDQDYYRLMADRMATLLPATAEVAVRKSWAATIDFTPDHLPILGPLLVGGRPVGGTVVAAAGGHGMMWGPAVARVAADLATDRAHGRRRRERPGSRPVRRGRPQPAGRGPDRPPVPRRTPRPRPGSRVTPAARRRRRRSRG